MNSFGKKAEKYVDVYESTSAEKRDLLFEEEQWLRSYVPDVLQDS